MLLAHGIAHLAGFVVPWKLMSIADLPYRTTILGGVIDVGYLGVRAIGVMWLLTGAAFVVLAIAVGIDVSWWYRGVLLTAAVSTTACVVEWPQARPGVLMNAVVIATAVVGHSLADV